MWTKLFRRGPHNDPAPEPADRRAPAARCAGCKRANVPLVLLENHKTYCERCDIALQDLSSYRTTGRRATDLRTVADGPPAEQRTTRGPDEGIV